MAIALDALTTMPAAGSILNASGTTNYTHVCGASATLLVVLVGQDNSATNQPSGLTYNSVALTKATAADSLLAAGETGGTTIWYLAGPSTGSNTLAVTWPAIPAGKHYITSWTGITSPELETGNHGEGVTANPGVAVTTAGTGERLVVGILRDEIATSPSADSHTTLEMNDVGAFTYASQYQIQAAPGAITLSWTVASDDYNISVAAFKAGGGGGGGVTVKQLAALGVG